ncbi:uncharacterized protein LOC123226266 isoform X2 [Mangifera indica]|uniref:uncharacterized protein LOC123226266 isoform X2 n=1 Tax=Mangifera indica TaxID=29780 RepID=UPI001CF93524|nr:uncharacterized protein LOC123226266 isoform X2 [Mangifera indica]
MDLENCSVSSSLSPSPSSAAEVSDDRLVEMELEAAEALADLAHLAMRESGGGGTVTNWGLKGKRVKSDSLSPPGPSGMNLTPIDPVQHCSDPAEQDQVELDQERDETVCSNVIIKQIKAEKEAEPSSVCSTRYTSVGGGGRSRQNLTEAEKEARRVRRVLANRESARQTIRRRQALCEELARKAADLARENESLKRKKDMASKEYKYLETINKHLKTLTAKALKSQVDKFSGELKSAHAEMSVSPSANCPMLLYNHHPFPPVGWPYIIKDSHPLQSGHGLQNPVIIPSNIPTPVVRKLDSQDQENPININTMGAPFYIVPCPWFAPHGNGFHAQPPDSQKIVQDETSRHNGYDGFSSSQSFTNMEKPLYRAKANNEVSDSTEVRTPTDLKNIPVEFSLSKGGQRNGPLPRDATFTPALPGSVGGTSIVNHGPDYTCNTEAISVKANHIANALPEKRQQVANYPSQKVADAIAAAEARKRRKELTKLKHLHGRQCRLHC